MFFNSLGILAGVWLFSTPLLWPHTATQTAVSVILGLAALIMSAGAIFSARLRLGVAMTGFLLWIASFVSMTDMGTMASGVATGLLLVMGGLGVDLGPRRVPQTTPVRLQIVAIAPEPRRRARAAAVATEASA